MDGCIPRCDLKLDDAIQLDKIYEYDGSSNLRLLQLGGTTKLLRGLQELLGAARLLDACYSES